MTLATLVAGGLAFPALLPAGEALVFSGAQSRPDPQQLLKKAKEKEMDGTGKLTPSNPALLVTPNQLPVPREKTLDRRTRNALIEGKNWVDYDKGELDARDEERSQLGILETGASGVAGDPDADVRHGRPGQPRLNSRLSSLPASRLESKNNAAAQARRPAEDTKNADGTKGAPGATASSQGGVADMNLRSLLAPGKANSLAPMDRSTVTWHDIFGGTPSGRSPAAEAGPREESVAADGFRGVAPGGSLTPAAPGGDALRFRSDFAIRPGALGGASSPSFAPEPALGPPPGARSFTSLAPPSAPKAPVADFSRPQGINPGALGRQDSLNPLAPPTPAYPAYGTPAAQPASGSAFNTLPSRPR